MSFFSTLFGKTDNSELLSAVIKEGAYLVDVRTVAEFSAGSAKGAVNIPLDRISDQRARFKDKRNIVVFCQSGNRSSKAKNILAQMGIPNVVNGGTWQAVHQIVINK